MMTIKISTVDELEKAWPVLCKLEPFTSNTSSYNRIKASLPRFIFIHRSPRRSNTWTHGMHQNHYSYPLLDISALYNLEETNPELFI